jgi:hypothetical protein
MCRLSKLAERRGARRSRHPGPHAGLRIGSLLAEGLGTVRTIAALTFTENAAGEVRFASVAGIAWTLPRVIAR